MLHPIADDIWELDYTVKMPLMQLPSRTTIVRLGDGSLVALSPGPIDASSRDALAELGEVRHLVAPNLFHHLHLADAAAMYPQARIYGPGGLLKKNGRLRGLTLEPLQALEQATSGALQPHPIEGIPVVAETVFLHVKSRSLVLTDLAFNVEQPSGPGMFLVFHMFGTYRRFRTSRLLKLLAKDRAAAAASIRAMLDLDFERIIVGHGQNVEERAKERAHAAMAPLLG